MTDALANLQAELDQVFLPGANKWSAYNAACLLHRRKPLLGTVDQKEIEDMAREKCRDEDRMSAFNYVFGSAGTCATEKRNREAFAEWQLVPRMLRDATSRNLETTLFGHTYPSPLLLAPIGVQGIIHPDAELASARAAASLGIPFIMSTASTRSIEDVASSSLFSPPSSLFSSSLSSSTLSSSTLSPSIPPTPAPRWFQLYWPRTPSITASLLSRAKQNGFSTLVVTLDTMTLGWRPHDLSHSYLPFAHGTGCAVGLSDPVFMAKIKIGQEPWPVGKYVEFPYDPEVLEEKIKKGDDVDVEKRKVAGACWLGEVNSGKYRTWEDIKELRELWEGPIVLKGIQSVADAEIAIDWVDGIVVSNHGGRQVDGAIASLDALSEIMASPKILQAQASGKLTVLFDSGIRNGSDILKALALGAQGVFLGRPYIYGLALAGEEGVAEQIRTILADLELTMGLVGCADVASVRGNTALLRRFSRARGLPGY